MNAFLTTMFKRGKLRAILAAAHIAVGIMNVGVAVHRLARGDVQGWANVLVLVFLIVCLMMNYAMFKGDDARKARAEAMARHSAPATESILIVPSSEATDPQIYAMMKSWETGEPVHIHCDDQGVWRDSITGDALPDRVQGK